MQYSYRFRYLVSIDKGQSIVNVLIYEIRKIVKSFLVIKSSKKLSVFIGKSCICPVAEVWGDRAFFDSEDNTILQRSDDNEYIFLAEIELKKVQYRRQNYRFDINYGWQYRKSYYGCWRKTHIYLI